MTTRAVGLGRGWAWLASAVNLGGHNAVAIFGGAALMLVLVAVLAVGLVLLVGGVLAAGQGAPATGIAGSMLVSLLVFLPLMFVICALTVGYLRLIDAVESGRPATATDVLSGFRHMDVSARALGFVVLLSIAQYLLLAVLIAVLAPDFGKWYLEMVQASAAGAAPPTPDKTPREFWPIFAVILVVTMIVYSVQAIGMGQIALRGRGVFAALADGASGGVKNVLPLVVLLLICIGAAVLAGLAVLLVVMLLGLLAKVVGAWLAVLLAIPLYIAVLIALYVVAFGVMYFMWRDICGEGDRQGAAADRVEV